MLLTGPGMAVKGREYPLKGKTNPPSAYSIFLENGILTAI